MSGMTFLLSGDPDSFKEASRECPSGGIGPCALCLGGWGGWEGDQGGGHPLHVASGVPATMWLSPAVAALVPGRGHAPGPSTVDSRLSPPLTAVPDQDVPCSATTLEHTQPPPLRGSGTWTDPPSLGHGSIRGTRGAVLRLRWPGEPGQRPGSGCEQGGSVGLPVLCAWVSHVATHGHVQEGAGEHTMSPALPHRVTAAASPSPAPPFQEGRARHPCGLGSSFGGRSTASPTRAPSAPPPTALLPPSPSSVRLLAQDCHLPWPSLCSVRSQGVWLGQWVWTGGQHPVPTVRAADGIEVPPAPPGSHWKPGNRAFPGTAPPRERSLALSPL